MTNRRYTLEYRMQVVNEYLESRKKYSEIGKQYGLSASLVRTWVKRYQEFGMAGLEDRRNQRAASPTPKEREDALRAKNVQLKQENYLLKMELEQLKKAKMQERENR